jgi:hypothetical protein
MVVATVVAVAVLLVQAQRVVAVLAAAHVLFGPDQLVNFHQLAQEAHNEFVYPN